MNKNTKLIAARELKIRMKSNNFRIMYLSFLLVAVLVPWLTKSSEKPSSMATTATSFNASYLGILFIMYAIIGGSNSLLTYGLIEEKSSSILDILLTSVRPEDILNGKIVGIVTLSILETISISAVGYLSSYFATGNGVHLTIDYILLSFVWILPSLLLLGYPICFFTLSIKKIEDVGIITLPLLLISGICLAAGMFSYISSDGTFSKIIKFIPPFSSFAAPILMNTHKMSWLQGSLIYILLLAVTFAIYKLSKKGFEIKSIK